MHVVVSSEIKEAAALVVRVGCPVLVFRDDLLGAGDLALVQKLLGNVHAWVGPVIDCAPGTIARIVGG